MKSPFIQLIVLGICVPGTEASLASTTEVWSIGRPDGSHREFAEFGRHLEYSREYPGDVHFTIGESDPAEAWPGVQPGPVILFAERHAELAEGLAAREREPRRQRELLKIAEVCRHVPAHAPRDFHDALQYYWFCHLAVITQLNGWDSFNPGHLDQHLRPFYEKDLAEGTLTEESARELLECFRTCSAGGAGTRGESTQGASALNC